MKHVKETLGQFQDFKYFSLLEEKKDLAIDEKKIKQEEEKEGIDIINKLADNLERFKSAAGGKIIKYKEFWEENKKAVDSFDGQGQLYKMFDSDYIAGTLMLPDEALSDEEIENQIKQVDSEKESDEKSDNESEEKEESEESEETEDKEDDKGKDKTKEIKESLNEEEQIDLNLDDKEGSSDTTELDAELDTKEGGEEINTEDSENLEGSDMEFTEDGETKEYFAVFNMSGSEREEVFRTDSTTVIEKFKDFFENSFKGSMKEQIQKFKQAQEEKKKEAEMLAREKIRQEKKGKLDKFMKESINSDILISYGYIGFESMDNVEYALGRETMEEAIKDLDPNAIVKIEKSKDFGDGFIIIEQGALIAEEYLEALINWEDPSNGWILSSSYEFKIEDLNV